jgi:hypothetical protein
LGYNLDLWDDGMLARKGKAVGGKLVFGDVKYPIVVLNNPQNMPLATARALEDFAKGGGILVSIGARTSPTHVPGYQTSDADQNELQAIMGQLFGSGGPGIVAKDEKQFADLVGRKLAPDVQFDPANTALSIVHRHADGGEVCFVANTSNQGCSVKATFRVSGVQPEIWNPLNGRVRSVAAIANTAATTTVSLDLAPFGSTVVVFSERNAKPEAVASDINPIDLSTDWNVTFASGPGGEGKPVAMDKLVSWTDLPDMKNYSGVGSYEKKVTIPADVAKAAVVVLNLGDLGQAGPPVADAAVVYINGQRAGAAWCPPYQVDVTDLLKEGENTVRIDVGNTAVNYLAKAGFPNYDLQALRRKYGNRFQPQGMELYAQPLPSGLIGPIKLEARGN